MKEFLPYELTQLHRGCVQGVKEHPCSYLSIIVAAFLSWIQMNQVGWTQHWRRGWVSLSESHRPQQLMIPMILLLLSHITHSHPYHCS